jgi:ketosteroid isomerase-like protein
MAGPNPVRAILARAMSQRNAEATTLGLVEAYYLALNDRDVEAVLDLFADNAEYLPFNVSVLEGGSYRGHDGIRKFFDEASDTWEYLRAEPQTYKTVGSHVVVTGHLRARSKQSGVEVDSPAAWLWTIRNGKAVRMCVYLDPKEALEDAGLRG